MKVIEGTIQAFNSHFLIRHGQDMVLNTKVKCAVQGNTDCKVKKLNHFSSNQEFVSNPLNPLSCELKIKIVQG